MGVVGVAKTAQGGVMDQEFFELSEEGRLLIRAMLERYPGLEVDDLLEKAFKWYMFVQEVAKHKDGYVGFVVWPGGESEAELKRIVRPEPANNPQRPESGSQDSDAA